MRKEITRREFLRNCLGMGAGLVFPGDGRGWLGLARLGEWLRGRNEYEVFHPKNVWNLGELKATQTPSYEKMLKAHGLTEEAVQKFWVSEVGWEPALYTVELTPDKYGNTRLPLLPGYVYTVALSNGSVEIFWGGDPKIEKVNLQWGFSARWVPAYLKKKEGNWLDLDDPRELAVREYRFGRYLRNPAMVDIRPDVPYFGRLGPYYTGTGNLDVEGWVPPDINATVPRNYMDACAMLGGRCNEKEWISAEPGSGGFLNWSWKYEGKVPGSADYCPPGDPCWQTVYIPSLSRGYVEVWLSKGTTGPNGQPVEKDGSYKFFASQAHILQDGLHQVDEFSYHADPNR